MNYILKVYLSSHCVLYQMKNEEALWWLAKKVHKPCVSYAVVPGGGTSLGGEFFKLNFSFFATTTTALFLLLQILLHIAAVKGGSGSDGVDARHSHMYLHRVVVAAKEAEGESCNFAKPYNLWVHSCR